jgi:plasmid stability protein
MPQLLVRDLDTDTMEGLKELARLHNRSISSEARDIISKKTKLSRARMLSTIEEWSERLKGRKFGDSAGLVAGDRSR